MGTGGFLRERVNARTLTFGFDVLGEDECIKITQVDNAARVCLDLETGLSEWKGRLSTLTQVERRLIWVTLVGYRADEYNYDQLKLLTRLRAALECLGAHNIELPRALKARYREFRYAEIKGVAEFTPALA